MNDLSAREAAHTVGTEARTAQPRLLRRYEWSLATGWTLVIVVILLFNIVHEQSQALELARTQARSNYQRDVIYRHWNARLNALYAPVTEAIQPNPHLKDHPRRDVVTHDGTQLTLINPAYMTRLVFDLAAQQYDVIGHITSLNPIRPENAPDRWETSALREFDRGETEVSAIETRSGETYLRLMRPLKTDPECLNCHRRQGYRVGDIRGGISVSVPMEPLRQISRQNIYHWSAGLAFLWMAGMAGIFTGAGRLRRTMLQRDRAEQEIIVLNRNLLAQTEELRSANRELESFCATVSHDLRTPLTGISGYCQLMDMELAEKREGEALRDCTDRIQNSVGKMKGLIDTLLKFSRISRTQLTRQQVNLSMIAEEVAMELRELDRERQVSFSIQDDVLVEGDADLLHVAMQNLLGNAWKYSSCREETEIAFGAVRNGDKIVCFVQDNGIGFDMAQSGIIFEAFQRLPNARGHEGTGIGLATVKRIITRHGGRIWCEASPGTGATFYFTL